MADGDALLRLAMAHPAEADAAARAVLASAGDPRSRTYAHHALGIVRREQGDTAAALRSLRAGLRVAERHGLQDRAADVGATLGTVLALRGRTAEADAVFATALRRCRGVEAARVRMRRGAVLQWSAGRRDEALGDYRAALPVFRRHADRLWEARTLYNRGLLLVELGELDRAAADLVRAEEVQLSADQVFDAAIVRHGRAEVARLAGDLPAALAHLDRARALYVEAGAQPPPELHADRARVLMAAGLPGDALAAADAALVGVGEGPAERSVRRAGVLLCAAEAALEAGDLARAGDHARSARRAYDRLGNSREAARAAVTHLGAAGRARAGDRRVATEAAALAGSDDLDAAGRSAARLLAGRLALECGDRAAAEAQLAAAARARRRGPALVRARGWLAAALRASLRGRPAEVLRACEEGLGVLDEHRLTLGATEMRAAATRHGAELAELGLRHALAGGDPLTLLAWSERWRATALALPPVRPPDDRALAGELTAIRELGRRLATARTEGRPTAALERELTALEAAARDRTLRVRGDGSGPAARAEPADVLAALAGAGALLVELVAVDGVLHALVADGSGVRRHEVGPLEAAAKEVELARFALHRAARGSGVPAVSAALAQAVEDSAGRLQELLLGAAVAEIGGGGFVGSGRDGGDRPVVVVPPGRLHAVPWALLPALRHRPVTVAPSAGTWLRARRTRAPAGPGGRVALVGGPGLGTGGAELPALAAAHPSARVLRAGDATVAAVLEALDGAALAHVAAHGRFRADNPMFSALELDDGPLTVHDLSRLGRAPYRVVLSACESALAAATGADELLGLASALLPLGTAGLVASVVPVNDAATVPVTVALHAALQAGAGTAEALLAARTAVAGDPLLEATAAAFVAHGAA